MSNIIRDELYGTDDDPRYDEIAAYWAWKHKLNKIMNKLEDIEK